MVSIISGNIPDPKHPEHVPFFFSVTSYTSCKIQYLQSTLSQKTSSDSHPKLTSNIQRHGAVSDGVTGARVEPRWPLARCRNISGPKKFQEIPRPYRRYSPNQREGTFEKQWIPSKVEVVKVSPMLLVYHVT